MRLECTSSVCQCLSMEDFWAFIFCNYKAKSNNKKNYFMYFTTNSVLPVSVLIYLMLIYLLAQEIRRFIFVSVGDRYDL